jgi:mRNA interferase MazF
MVSDPTIRRGEIWWASLPEPVASEPGSRRPLLVVQSDSFNRSRVQTVLAVVLTTNLDRADAPGNVFLSRKETGLPKDSVANVTQVVTADRRFLTERVSVLPARRLAEVGSGLLLVLDLEGSR